MGNEVLLSSRYVTLLELLLNNWNTFLSFFSIFCSFWTWIHEKDIYICPKSSIEHIKNKGYIEKLPWKGKLSVIWLVRYFGQQVFDDFNYYTRRSFYFLHNLKEVVFFHFISEFWNDLVFRLIVCDNSSLVRAIFVASSLNFSIMPFYSSSLSSNISSHGPAFYQGFGMVQLIRGSSFLWTLLSYIVSLTVSCTVESLTFCLFFKDWIARFYYLNPH